MAESGRFAQIENAGMVAFWLVVALVLVAVVVWTDNGWKVIIPLFAVVFVLAVYSLIKESRRSRKSK